MDHQEDLRQEILKETAKPETQFAMAEFILNDESQRSAAQRLPELAGLIALADKVRRVQIESMLKNIVMDKLDNGNVLLTFTDSVSINWSEWRKLIGEHKVFIHPEFKDFFTKINPGKIEIINEKTDQQGAAVLLGKYNLSADAHGLELMTGLCAVFKKYLSKQTLDSGESQFMQMVFNGAKAESLVFIREANSTSGLRLDFGGRYPKLPVIFNRNTPSYFTGFVSGRRRK